MISSAQLRPLVLDGEQGWVNLQFGLLGVHEPDENFVVVGVGARHADREIGFNVLIPRRGECQSGDPASFEGFAGGMVLVGIGVQSDRFLASLSSLYGLTAIPERMAKLTEVSAISLQGNPERILSEPVATKIFFCAYPDSGVPYAEAFLSFDIPRGTIEFHEKDPEYRQAIVDALVKGTPDER